MHLTAEEERDWLAAVVDNVGEPVILTDLHNSIVLQNEKAKSLFAAAEADAENRQQACSANNGLLSEIVAGFPADGGLASREVSLVDPAQGREVQYEVISRRACNPRTGEEGVVFVLRNVSELKQANEELRSSFERVRQLEQQLFESEKLAAAGRLAASIAHEINNPLQAIKNALYLVSRRFTGNPEDQQFLDIAERETVRVSRIIQEMLGFYRGSLTAGPVSVNALLEEVLVLLREPLDSRGVTVERELDPNLPSVLGYGDQLKQVFLNIMLNNQDAMPCGGRLSLRSFSSTGKEPSDASYPTVNLEFTDTGEGISPEILPHIFEPFFSTKAEKGTGLGLWVSFGIVQRHHGHISVRSQPDRGTTFTVSFPAMAQV